MTALPAPGRLLTIADYEALPEEEMQRWELLEGNLVMSPSPVPRHNVAISELYGELRRQLPAALVVVPDVDLNLEFAPDNAPATVRRPDLVVVTREEFVRVDRGGGVFRAGGVRLVVEVISVGSRRNDQLIKRGEYADAGIPHYWIIDLDKPVSLVDCRFAAHGYEDDGAINGIFEAADPFPVQLDLDALI